MVVTCPSCDEKFRVNDADVPAEGAKLQCSACGSLFVAMKPKPVPPKVDGLSSPYMAAPVVRSPMERTAPKPAPRPPSESGPAEKPELVVAKEPKPPILTGRQQRELAERREAKARRLGSVAVALAAVFFTAALAFAGWTAGALPLGGALMPVAESVLRVRPPRSMTGRDDRAAVEVDERAKRAQARGDLIDHAVQRLRAQRLETSSAREKASADAVKQIGARASP